ncbi:hypothetical protein [Persephonella sp.]
MEIRFDLDYTVAVLNMGIFLFLLEGIVIYKKDKIKRSLTFLISSLFFIYVIDMSFLALLNTYFNWYEDLTVLLFNQTLIYILMSFVYVAYYFLIKFFKVGRVR